MGSCPDGMMPAPGGGCMNHNPTHGGGMKKGGRTRPVAKYPHGGSHRTVRNNRNRPHTHRHTHPHRSHSTPGTACGGMSMQQCISNPNCDWIGSSPNPNMGTCISAGGMRRGGKAKPRRRMARGGRTRPRMTTQRRRSRGSQGRIAKRRRRGGRVARGRRR